MRQNLGCGQRPCGAGERRRSSPPMNARPRSSRARGCCGVMLRSPTRCENSLHVPTPRGWDGEFESVSLQRRVCEPSVPLSWQIEVDQTHDYPISAAEAKELGLPVSTEMLTGMLELMTLYPQPTRSQRDDRVCAKCRFVPSVWGRGSSDRGDQGVQLLQRVGCAKHVTVRAHQDCRSVRCL